MITKRISNTTCVHVFQACDILKFGGDAGGREATIAARVSGGTVKEARARDLSKRSVQALVSGCAVTTSVAEFTSTELYSHIRDLQRGTILSSPEHNRRLQSLIESARKAMESAATHGESANSQQFLELHSYLSTQLQRLRILETPQVMCLRGEQFDMADVYPGNVVSDVSYKTRMFSGWGVLSGSEADRARWHAMIEFETDKEANKIVATCLYKIASFYTMAIVMHKMDQLNSWLGKSAEVLEDVRTGGWTEPWLHMNPAQFVKMRASLITRQKKFTQNAVEYCAKCDSFIGPHLDCWYIKEGKVMGAGHYGVTMEAVDGALFF